MITGKKLKNLSKIINHNTKHSLYREDGKWYHHLKEFPGILYDRNGYVIFDNNLDNLNHPSLQHGQDLHIPEGVSSVFNYKIFTEEEKKYLSEIFSSW